MEHTQQQEFFDAIHNYQFIDINGRMDLELFCVVMSKCFYADGILEKTPDPRSVYFLLIDALYEKAESERDTEKLKKLWVQTQNIVDWTPESAEVYPDKFRTFIHVGGLFSVFSIWISAIGYDLMGIPEPKKVTKYYDWVDQKWTHVYEFFDGFHNGLFEFVKEIDRKSISKNGYSTYEALHLAKKVGIDLDQAIIQLKQRKQAHSEAILQMEAAIASSFYLEAITLQECLISNCLYNCLKARNSNQKVTSFYELLKKINKKKSFISIDDRKFFNNIELWRKNRNTAIHGFISSRGSELGQSRLEFSSFSEKTAKEGVELCIRIGLWFEYETVNYLETQFPKEKQISH